MKPNWKSVALFYFLACTWSWPFFWWRDMEPESWRAWAVPDFIKNWSYMSGPAIAALVVLWIYRKSHPRTITLLGTSPRVSLLFFFVPMLIRSAIGMQDEEGTFSHFIPLLLLPIALTSHFGEEMGWRGFLQDALRPLKPLYRYALIGILWEAWHFTNRTHMGSLTQIVIRVTIFGVMCIGLSALIGRLTDKTKSVLVAISCHLWVNMLFEGQPRLFIAFGLSVVFWYFLLRNSEPQTLAQAVETVPSNG